MPSRPRVGSDERFGHLVHRSVLRRVRAAVGKLPQILTTQPQVSTAEPPQASENTDKGLAIRHYQV